MGSRSKINLAYIAGFLDGDGSLMFQLKKRKDSLLGRRFMVTICFYQDSRHEKPLFWIKKVIGRGYISRRNDGITELRINGYARIESLIKDLLPFIRFKKKQAVALYKASKILSNNKKLNSRVLERIIDLMLIIQSENYVTHKKKTKTELRKILGLTP